MSNSAFWVAWISFGLGAALLLAGVIIGLYMTFAGQVAKAKEKVREKVNEAKAKIDELKTTAVMAAQTASESTTAATEASGAAEAAKTTLDQVADIIGSLPEAMRFPGLLVLVGTILVSVATVQFGGHPLF
jgi:hypothetical protein